MEIFVSSDRSNCGASLKSTPMEVTFRGKNSTVATFIYSTKVRLACKLNEEVFFIIKLYSNKFLYSKFGHSFYVRVDVALAKESLEEVVERVYSVMKCQK